MIPVLPRSSTDSSTSGRDGAFKLLRLVYCLLQNKKLATRVVLYSGTCVPTPQEEQLDTSAVETMAACR